MNDVAEFIRIREQIEAQTSDISRLLGEGRVAEPKVMLDQAGGLLTQLAAMVDNDIQVTAVGRLTRLLDSLSTKVASLEKKKRPAKKPRSRATASHN
jgi:hypothetical protein